MIDIGLKYYRFGSADSADVDVMIEHDLASCKDDTPLIQALKEQYPAISNWDVKLIKIEQGRVTHCMRSKGSPDSAHNCLYYTYHLHPQVYPFPLAGPVERNKPLALVKCTRTILGFLRGSNYHGLYLQHMRLPLRQFNWQKRVDALRLLDYRQHLFDDDLKNRKVLKSIAFYIGQTLSLFQDIEIYTKTDLCKYHPELTPLIKKEVSAAHELLYAKVEALCQLIATLHIRQLARRIITCGDILIDLKSEEAIASIPENYITVAEEITIP